MAQPAAKGKKWSVRPHEPLIGMVILSVAFIIGSLSVDAGLRSRNQPPRTDQITVTGSAEQTVTADTFQWDASVASTQPTTSGALRQLNRWTAEIRAALDNAGAHDAEITFGSVEVQPNTDETGTVTSFTESQAITVRSRRLSAMRRVLGVSDQLLARNVPFIAQAGVHLQRSETAAARADGRGERGRPSARPSGLGPQWPSGEVDLDLGGPVLRGCARVSQYRQRRLQHRHGAAGRVGSGDSHVLDIVLEQPLTVGRTPK